MGLDTVAVSAGYIRRGRGSWDNHSLSNGSSRRSWHFCFIQVALARPRAGLGFGSRSPCIFLRLLPIQVSTSAHSGPSLALNDVRTLRPTDLEKSKWQQAPFPGHLWEHPYTWQYSRLLLSVRTLLISRLLAQPSTLLTQQLEWQLPVPSDAAKSCWTTWSPACWGGRISQVTKVPEDQFGTSANSAKYWCRMLSTWNQGELRTKPEETSLECRYLKNMSRLHF